MLAIQSLRLPRSSEAWFGIAIAQQQALGSTDFDASSSPHCCADAHFAEAGFDLPIPLSGL